MEHACRPGWRMRTVALAGCVWGGWLAAPTGAPAATFYVAPTGSDQDDGLAARPESGTHGPLASLQRAVELAQGGDTIALRAGTYDAGATLRRAYAPKPLTLTRYNQEVATIQPSAGAGVILDGAGAVHIRELRFSATQAGSPPLQVLHASGIVISNCTFLNVAAQRTGAVLLQDVRDSILVDCRFRDNAARALSLNQIRNCRVEDNRFEDNRATVTLFCDGDDSRDNTIARNELVDNFAPGGFDNMGIWLNHVGRGNTLLANTVRLRTLPAGAMEGLNAAGIRVTSSDDVEIRGNLISNYQFHGTVDLTYAGPQYRITPEQGGRTGHGLMVNSDNPTERWCRRIRVLDNVVVGSGNHGINLLYLNNSQIAGNISVSNGHYGIHLHGNDASRVVTGNVVELNVAAENGWLNGGMSGISLTGVGRGNIVRRNTCYRNRQGTAGRIGYNWFGDGIGIILDANSDGTLVENNLCFDNEGSGLVLLHSSDCTVIHNTIVGNGNCPHFVDFPGMFVYVSSNAAAGSASGNLIANNIIFNNRARPLDLWDPNQIVHHNLLANGPLTEDLARLNNIVAFVNDAAVASQPFLSFSQWQAYWAARGNNAVGDLNADPRLWGGTTPATAADCALGAASPCVDAGVHLARVEPEVDHAGRPRRAQSRPDMGALEFGSRGLWDGAVDLGNGWRWSAWFGYIYTVAAPWVYHQEHGWLYPFGTDPANVTFWDAEMNALWWTSETHYPYLWRFRDAVWLWYLQDSDNPRWLLKVSTGTWFSL